MYKYSFLIWPGLIAGLFFLFGCEKTSNPENFSSPQQDSRLGKHTSIAMGRATAHPVNQSKILGTINFTDDGTTLTVQGTASGLEPGVTYTSLIYDNGSVSGGPTACEPVTGALTQAQMFVGSWSVDANGNGMLGPVSKSGANYAALDEFRTISIRDTRINGGIGPQAVVACGQVADHPTK